MDEGEGTLPRFDIEVLVVLRCLGAVPPLLRELSLLPLEVEDVAIALQEAGVEVIKSPAEIGETVARLLS